MHLSTLVKGVLIPEITLGSHRRMAEDWKVCKTISFASAKERRR